MLYSKSRLSSTVKAAYWLLNQIEKLLAGHEKFIHTSHKAVNEWTVSLIGRFSESAISLFPTIAFKCDIRICLF